MLSHKVLVLHALRCAVICIRVDELRHEVHLRNLLQYHSIVDSLSRIFAPGERTMVLAENSRYIHRVFALGERTMVLAENSRYIHRVFALEGFHDNEASVLLVAFLNLLCG